MDRFDSRRFNLVFPEHWKDTTQFSFDGPEVSGVKHSLMVTLDEESKPKDLVSYAKDRIALLMETLECATVLKEGELETDTGFTGYEVVYKWSPVEGAPLFQRQTWIIAEDVVFNFVASFSKKTIKTVGQEIDLIIHSFMFGAGAEVVSEDKAPEKKKLFGLFGGGAKKAVSGIKKPLAKKPLVKKPLVKKPVAKKPLVKKPNLKKPVLKKSIAKKPVNKKLIIKKGG